MNLRRLFVLAVALALLLPAAATAAPAPSLLAGPCLAGGSYDPACDVDRDNDVDIFDIQLTASRWNTNGVWTADGWSLTGNAGTTPANFLGTTDNKSLELRVNGTNALRILPGNSGRHTLVGGHSDNAVWAGVLGGTISGGGPNFANENNTVFDNWGTVGGGRGNRAGSDDANVSSDYSATVGGGEENSAVGRFATVSGGWQNLAGFGGTVGGGSGNDAIGTRATIAGGWINLASGAHATVGGGQQNTASGSHATVAGGIENTAEGDYSFAAGRRAKANHTGAFVLADSNDFSFASTVANSLRARFTGGMRMIVGIDGSGNYTVNCLLTQGTGSWSCSSSLAAMENVQAADSRDILERLSQVPVLTWQAGSEGVRHIGPAEEDFHAAFGLGQAGEGISTIDLDGVALASIQALYQMAQEKDAQIAALQQENADLQARLAAIEQALGIGQ